MAYGASTQHHVTKAYGSGYNTAANACIKKTEPADIKELAKDFAHTLFDLLLITQDIERKPWISCPAIIIDGERTEREQIKKGLRFIEIGDLKFKLDGINFNHLLVETIPSLSGYLACCAEVSIKALYKQTINKQQYETVRGLVTSTGCAAKIYADLSSRAYRDTALIETLYTLTNVASKYNIADKSSLDNFPQRLADIAYESQFGIKAYIDHHTQERRKIRNVSSLSSLQFRFPPY